MVKIVKKYIKFVEGTSKNKVCCIYFWAKLYFPLLMILVPTDGLNFKKELKFFLN